VKSNPFPALLRHGDTVAIIATSGPCDARRLENGVKAIASMGLRPIVMESCRLRHGYLAGHDDIRLRDLHAAFASQDVRGIFVARGGYGAARLLPRLDFSLIRQNPKVFVGYSDVTALHIAFNQFAELVTFHGPMPAADFGNDTCPHTMDALKAMVFTDAAMSSQRHYPSRHLHFCQQQHPGSQLNINQLQHPNHPLLTIVPGRAEGTLIGGNLSLIAASLGTPYEIDTRGKILFIEEVGEKPYSIDRLFLQLKQAGKLRDAAGILLGDFSPETMESLEICINELIVTEGKPTFAGLACGHTSPNLTLPLGAYVYT